MRTLLLALFLATCGLAQNPDCTFTSTYTASGAGTFTAYNNKPTAAGGTPCIYWEFVYWTNGASGVSIQLEGAADVAGASSGSYTALTAASGTSNPATGTTAGAAILCCDYYPWLRLNAGTFTGSSQTMTARAYGWRNQPTPSAGGGGGPTANVNVAQWSGTTAGNGGTAGFPGVGGIVASGATNSGVKPVKIGGPFNTTQPTVTNGQLVDGQFSARGSFLVTPAVEGFPVSITSGAVTGNITSINGTTSYGCGSQAPISISGSGNTQIVALSGSTAIRICHISLSTTPPENISFTSGTGSNCASSTATLASYQLVSALAFDFGPFSTLSAGASNALCVNQQNAQTTTGVVIYDQR